MTCQTCHHAKGDHSPLAGCTAKPTGGAFCQCSTYVPTPATKMLESVGPTIPARATDKRTSHAATPPPVKAGTQRARVLAGFAGLGTDGGMSETAAEAAGVSLSSEYAKRTSELQAGGLVEDTGATATGASGQERVVWRITDKGREVHAALGDPTPKRPPARRIVRLTTDEAQALVHLETRLAGKFWPENADAIERLRGSVATVAQALRARDHERARAGE